ncbi:ArsC family protein [Anaerobranca gottschalkii DSM 13577]|uniref:ArsC family protein n=1 Tax=Anaerobranca gottschalkii DSM 13577 TaxID=1120990 RepID=A0A1I0CNV9_9FIRM|nr:ArsC family protein [Anaerobranca gottschalkii DSM 13577]
MFNKNGKLYKELNLQNVIDELDDEKLIELLVANPMLVKRPIVTNFKDLVLVGFKEQEYIEVFKQD